ncbi:hypothetical protein LINPERHAP1_LOCUS1442 [Linum perenne]
MVKVLLQVMITPLVVLNIKQASMPERVNSMGIARRLIIKI